IAISEQTKRDAQRFLHIPADRLFVVYPAAAKQFGPDIPADEISRVRARYGLPREFVLAVGTTEPRKNLNRLLEAIGLLARRGIKLPLFVAGGRGWLSEPLYEYVRRQGLGSLVTFTGYVPENDLPALYKAASVFAYPSLYEGFGLPVLEAMACGTPTLTSNRSALIEAAGDAALLVNPESVTEIADGIQELIDDKAKRTDLARLGLEQSRKFSWEQSARQVLEIYRRIIKR
ncbi:MAG TPA: glycosyltransferase family 1 protein, partial [Blastocatellia bacterium]|nr:glycosyltransferase family 1 protein [Blastocatellia bacterium]